jgi:hypothetical protein
VVIPANQISDIMFDFLPRRINADYRKQITFTNLKNNNNDQFVDIRANNVDEQRVRFHSQFYHIETPFSMPCLDFDNVMVNSPTVRTFTIRNISKTLLRLHITSSLPDEVTLYKEGPGSLDTSPTRPLSSSPSFLPPPTSVAMSSSAPNATILSSPIPPSTLMAFPPQVQAQVQAQAQGQAAQAQAQAHVRRMEMLMKLMEDDIQPSGDSKKFNSYLDLAGSSLPPSASLPIGKRRTTLAWIDPTPAQPITKPKPALLGGKKESGGSENGVNGNDENNNHEVVDEQDSSSTLSPPRRHFLRSRSPSPIFSLDEDQVSPTSSPPRNYPPQQSPRGNKKSPSYSSLPMRTSASGFALPVLRTSVSQPHSLALINASPPNPSLTPTPTVPSSITTSTTAHLSVSSSSIPSASTEEESPTVSLTSSSSSLLTAPPTPLLATSSAPSPINLQDLAQKFEDTSPPPIFNDYEGEAKYILSQIDRIRQLDKAIVDGRLEPLSVLGILVNFRSYSLFFFTPFP